MVCCVITWGLLRNFNMYILIRTPFMHMLKYLACARDLYVCLKHTKSLVKTAIFLSILETVCGRVDSWGTLNLAKCLGDFLYIFRNVLNLIALSTCRHLCLYGVNSGGFRCCKCLVFNVFKVDGFELSSISLRGKAKWLLYLVTDK